ncbi:hypothetical protein BV898_19042 [Hypsibius exemplaris]|uniref:Uncharacterized protein n=1 Tax=Hypsibius exemplaris TaxID=2072580 RepID=A0A9X6NKQ6_HYPEX|nr:hypothetical protein BV898_19042 [Hypsibius exemplaris]
MPTQPLGLYCDVNTFGRELHMGRLDLCSSDDTDVCVVLLYDDSVNPRTVIKFFLPPMFCHHNKSNANKTTAPVPGAERTCACTSRSVYQQQASCLSYLRDQGTHIFHMVEADRQTDRTDRPNRPAPTGPTKPRPTDPTEPTEPTRPRPDRPTDRNRTDRTEPTGPGIIWSNLSQYRLCICHCALCYVRAVCVSSSPNNNAGYHRMAETSKGRLQPQ